MVDVESVKDKTIIHLPPSERDRYSALVRGCSYSFDIGPVQGQGGELCDNISLLCYGSTLYGLLTLKKHSIP